MILIVVQMPIRADRRDDWLNGIKRYAAAVRHEKGNLSFECFESVELPDRFIVVEGFESREASDQHVHTDVFREFMAWVPSVISEPPRIVNVDLPGDGWSEMAELRT